MTFRPHCTAISATPSAAEDEVVTAKRDKGYTRQFINGDALQHRPNGAPLLPA